MKKNITILLTLCLVFGFVGKVEAKVINENKEQRTTDRNTNVQNRAVEEINQRVEGLKKLIDKLNGMKKITDGQKVRLISQVQTEIDSLLKLGASLKSETDMAKLKEMRRMVVTSYRIYAVFIPRTNLLAYGDSLLSLADKMLALPNASEEAKQKITTSKEMVTKAMDKALSIIPASYPESTTTLKEIKNTLVEARQLLNGARKLIKK